MRVALSAVLLVHAAVSGYAVVTNGYLGAFPPFDHVWTYQIFSDPLVSLGLVWLFLFHEARRRGRALWKVWCCGVGIVFAGSLSPLLYLLLERDVLSAAAHGRPVARG